MEYIFYKVNTVKFIDLSKFINNELKTKLKWKN